MPEASDSRLTTGSSAWVVAQTTSARSQASSQDAAARTVRSSSPASSSASDLGLPAVASCNAQLPEGSDARHRAGVRAGLDPGAEDRKDRGILAGEKPRGEGGPGRGADRRDRIAVEKGRRPSIVRVEDRDQGLVGGQRRAGVTGEERDELARERSRGGGVTRHRRKQSLVLRNERPHAVGHGRPAGTQVGHRLRQRVYQCVEIEKLLDLSPTEEQHRRSYAPASSEPSTGRRLRIPARATTAARARKTSVP